MLSTASDLTKAAWFYAIALSLGLIATIVAITAKAEIAVLLYMFTPLLAVLALQLLLTRDGRSLAGWRQLGLDRLGTTPVPWLIALLLPPILLAIVWLLTIAVGAGRYAAPAEAITVGSVLLGTGGGCIFAFGEEIGWRGYLLPKLAALGLWPAMILSGFLHGAWHLPIILLTPFYHPNGSPWIVVPEFMAVLTMAGVFYGYLRHVTRSVWPVVLAHASFNEAMGRFGSITTADDPALLEYIGGESGLITVIVLLAIVTVIWWFWPATATADA